MKLIIAGSRTINPLLSRLDEAVADLEALTERSVTEVVSGGAHGVDQAGEAWAASAGIPVKRFIPRWDDLGRGAGYVRNREMAEYADALLAVWDGSSRGTAHMIREATARNLTVMQVVLEIKSPPSERSD